MSVTSPQEAALLRVDHVWSSTGSSRGDPRGFWLVLTSSGEVQLHRAHDQEFHGQGQASFVAASPRATNTKVAGRSLTMEFGSITRVVEFSGRKEGPFELLGAKDRGDKAREAWLPVLLGQTPWEQIAVS